MPRRRLDLPPPHRLAAVLGAPLPDDRSAGSPGSPVGRGSGWVPDAGVLAPEPRRCGSAAAAGSPVVSLPSSLVHLRARPTAAAVVGVGLVLVLAAAFFGARVLLVRHAAAPQPVAAVTSRDDQPDPGTELASPPAASGTGAAGGSAATTPTAPGVVAPAGAPAPGAPAGAPAPGAAASGSAPLPSAASVLLVHVVGQVRHPGVVRLEPGDRLQDAVKAAGGATRHADLSAVNLARPVADGEQVRIPEPGEQDGGTGVVGSTGGSVGAAGAGVAGTGTGAPGTGDTGVPGAEAPVDLNSATQEQLETLPGIGPVLAQRILEWRTAHGRFSSVEELLEVSGIGDKTFADLSARVTV